MASDANRPLLRLTVERQQERPAGRQRPIRKPNPFPREQQTTAFSPKFERLAQVLQRDPTGLALRADPTALAPERLLVFEVQGAIAQFAAAVRRVEGLELIDEEELESDGDETPVAYLMVPDVRALRELESLWRRWQTGKLVRGETPWRDVFELLRDLRPWGPDDRVQPHESNIFLEEITDRRDDELVNLEIELVFRSRADTHIAQESLAATYTQQEEDVCDAINTCRGRVLSRSRIDAIGYHALLVEVPVRTMREIIERSPGSIAGLDPIMYIRSQSVASTIEVADVEELDAIGRGEAHGPPILALLDGVPVAAHALLSSYLVVDDQFKFEPTTPVSDRIHGTAMASLIVHGDRNRAEAPLPRRIHVVPVLGARDEFPQDRLIVDLIYSAVVTMRSGVEATAPNVVIVNLSLGNRRRPFHSRPSPWARILDWLAYHYGILFIVSAGNYCESFEVPTFVNSTAFEDAAADVRAVEVLRALGGIVADRRLLAPAETVNGLTVGAYNRDWVSAADRVTARVNVDPFGDLLMANPSSALGPGFALSVKPDILMPGARERLRVVRNHTHIDVAPARASRSAGLKVAAPPRDGVENVGGFTNGSSAAAAFASRTAHRIYDALEDAYGERFVSLPPVQKAVLLKALVVHPAKWPETTAELIRATIGPPEGKYHFRQKDNIRRFLGFGTYEAEDAVACAADRATFWAVGTLERDKVSTVNVPVPAAMGGQARFHALSATLAWFTPTAPGRKSYRTVRLQILEPGELDLLSVRANPNQPDGKQTRRGTTFTRCWSGPKAPVIGPDMVVSLKIQRDPDQGVPIDEAVPFGLAVTLTMPGVIEIYEQVQNRLAISERPSI